VQLKDRNTDFLFWKNQTVIQRLEATELLRQQYINSLPTTPPGIQRVCKIIYNRQN
jgi:hypothetical protein